MLNLAVLIDSMPSPVLPDYFSEADGQILLMALSNAKQQARPYEGSYMAPWLLSDFDDAEWVTTNRGREEQVINKWKNVIKIDWGIRLPNGDALTDPKYRKLLDLNKRIAFLVRSGYVSGISAPVTWRAAVYVQLQLTRWAVLHEAQFHPAEYGFKLIDQFAVDSLLRAIAEGGWASAHRFPQRLLANFYQASFGEPCPQHLIDGVYELPGYVTAKMSSYLAANDYFGRVSRGPNTNRAYLRRERLAAAIAESVDSLRVSSKLNAFCRQFESDFQDGELLVNLFQETEYPDQKTKRIKDVLASGSAENTLLSVSSNLTTILSAYRQVPDLLPEPALISIRRAHNQALRLTRQSGHNQFIPVNIGLAYLNQAMRFVHVYGEALVDYYLAVVAARPKGTSNSLPERAMEVVFREVAGDQFTAVVEGVSRPIGTVLGINQFQRTGTAVDFELLRKQPTLDEALRVLIGACIVTIALMKPSRESELTHLKRDCLRQNSEGYHMHFVLGKSNAGEAYQDMDRPIPVITAKAIQLLQKLGGGLSSIFGDTRKITDNLFYLPKLQGGDGALVASPNLLNTHIDVFCDYVGMPPDHLGRRWYVRTHEMRKWFLLLLFWSGRYDVLDAARWIAGHTDAKHIYAYIEREFPGEELPKLEAEYAVDRLRVLESHGGNPERVESGLDALYATVLQHFKVQALSMVPDSEWVDYVTTLREANGFILEPHSVYANNTQSEVVGINVSFVLREPTQ
jgi:hypothetical protein